MQTPIQWVTEQWADLAGPALSALTGVQCRAAADEAPGPAEELGLSVWHQQTDAAVGAGLFVAAESKLWRRIGAMVLSAAGLDDAAEEEIRGTYLEALQQMLSPLAPALGGRLGREVNFGSGQETEFTPGRSWAALRLTAEEETLGYLYLGLSEELAASLAGSGEAAGAAEVTESKRGTALEAAPRMAASQPSKTLDLLLEVELPVGVSFGRTQMRVKDAIKLTTGSIVELNRSVSAPVEIIVNNCVIARGEVVVVEGNYGVRIQEIISREERLRTLF